MTAKLKHLKRGFTLVELMIVVAIVGILAALAIYGVSKYVKNAKTAEARDALGRMAKDAVTAYQKETMAPTVLSAGGVTAIAHQLCESAAAVPATVPAGAKYQSQPSDWAGAGWSCLKFTMNEPQYYQYDYNSPNPADAAATFECVATGNLDGDSDNSTFKLIGAVQNRTATYAPSISESSPEE